MSVELEPLVPSRHVPRLALHWIRETPDLRHRRVSGAMLFADISGFTALSERLTARGRVGAEELVTILGNVFGSFGMKAVERGGQLIKFGGDANLFLFSDEDTGGDAARQAAAAAVEIRAAIRRAASERTEVGRLRLSISIGVHAGTFDYYLVGAPHRELVVLGPGLTSVVHAENVAEAGEILLTPEAAAALPAAATVPAADGLRRLVWRIAPVAPSGSVPHPVDRDAARLLFPRILFGSFDGVQPDPAHRAATIGFMKFTGTDALLAAHGAERVADDLDRTLRIAQEAFEAEDIALLCVDCDVDGGKLFVSSGVPLTSEDDEGRMLRAARAIVGTQPPLPLQIGINRGHVFVGEVGIRRRASFSAMGDTTNTAARICGKAAPGEILVHPQVLEHSRSLYEVEPVGPYMFKGKAAPQMLYRLGAPIGPREPNLSDELPLVGREDELARIRAATLLVEGRGASVVIVGDVGVGKSRLLAEVRRGLPGLPTLDLHAEPYGSSSFRVFRDPIRAVLGVDRGTQAEMATALLTGIQEKAPHLDDVAALLGDVAQVEVPPSDTVRAILPEHRADRAADAVADLLATVHPDGMIVILEDGHWADASSARLVEVLAAQARRLPWIVLVSQRDAEDGVHIAEPDVLIALEPLSDDAVRQLAVSMTEAAPLRPDELAVVVERADGNPLFAREMIRAGQELGSMEAVPSSLQGAVAAQVDVLEPTARRALSYASVLGRSFRESVFTEVLASEGVDVARPAWELLDRFMAREEGRWQFRHGVLRDVVYDGLGYRLRARLHLAAGSAVERLSTDLGADADALALHFARGGDHRKAFTYAAHAAARSEAAHASAAAAAQLSLALESARRLTLAPRELRSLWLRLAAAYDLGGRLEQAIDALRQAGRLSTDPRERAEVWLKRAEVRQRTGAFRAALRDTSRAGSLIHSSAAAADLEARYLVLVARIRMRQEKAQQALHWALLAARVATATGDDAALAQAEAVLTWAHYFVDRPDRSWESGHLALRLFEKLGDANGTAQMANDLGGIAYYTGDWTASARLYRDSRDAYLKIGHVGGAALAATNLGEVLVSQGRVAEALPLLEEAARVTRASRLGWTAAFADLHLGRAYMALQDLAQAEELLRRCVRENRAMGSADSVFEAAIHLGACLVADGRPEEALEVVADGALGHPSMLDAAASLTRARALAVLHRAAEARAEVALGIVVARERQLPFELAQLLLLQAELGGDPTGVDEAQTLLVQLGVTGSVSPAPDAGRRHRGRSASG